MILKKAFIIVAAVSVSLGLPFFFTACSGESSALVGKWVYESGVTYGKPADMMLLKNGTGVCDGVSITWEAEGNRLIIKSAFFGFACDYRLSDSKLTLSYGDGGRATFVKQ